MSLTFVWRINGATVRTFNSATSLTDHVDLKALGNFKKGDIVTVDVTPSDGLLAGAPARATATISNGSGKALVVAAPENGPSADTAALTSSMLRPIIAEAVHRWQAAEIDASQLETLRSLAVQVADLPDAYLGLAGDGVIVVDQNAAGYGWFIDPTPADDREFAVAGAGPAWGHVDLLSVVLHELGLNHDETDDLMNEALPLGSRRLPEPLDAARARKLAGSPAPALSLRGGAVFHWPIATAPLPPGPAAIVPAGRSRREVATRAAASAHDPRSWVKVIATEASSSGRPSAEYVDRLISETQPAGPGVVALADVVRQALRSH